MKHSYDALNNLYLHHPTIKIYNHPPCTFEVSKAVPFGVRQALTNVTLKVVNYYY